MSYEELWGHKIWVAEQKVAGTCAACDVEMYEGDVEECPQCGKEVHETCLVGQGCKCCMKKEQ